MAKARATKKTAKKPSKKVSKKAAKKPSKKVSKKAAKKPSKKVSKKTTPTPLQEKEKNLKEAQGLLKRMADAGTFEGFRPVARAEKKCTTQILIQGCDIYIIQRTRQPNTQDDGTPSKSSHLGALLQLAAGSNVEGLPQLVAAAGSKVSDLQQFLAAGSQVSHLHHWLGTASSNVRGLLQILAAGSNVEGLPQLMAMAASHTPPTPDPSETDVVVIHIKAGNVKIHTGDEAKRVARRVTEQF